MSKKIPIKRTYKKTKDKTWVTTAQYVETKKEIASLERVQKRLAEQIENYRKLKKLLFQLYTLRVVMIDETIRGWQQSIKDCKATIAKIKSFSS